MTTHEHETDASAQTQVDSPEDDKASLEAAQQVLAKHLADIKAVKGVKSVQRTVCGGCLDFKVATALGDSDFGAWEEAGFLVSFLLQ